MGKQKQIEPKKDKIIKANTETEQFIKKDNIQPGQQRKVQFNEQEKSLADSLNEEQLQPVKAKAFLFGPVDKFA